MFDNRTEGKSHKMYGEYFCSGYFTEGIHKQLIGLSAFNIFLSVSALLGNTLILVALYKTSSLHPPSRLLFSCLATTDLCVGISEPFLVLYWISDVYEKWDICRYSLAISFFTGYTLCSVSLLTLSALSIDRLLALSLSVRYRQVVTLKRAYVLVTIFWLTAVLGASFYFWNYNITLYYSYIGLSLCLMVSIFCYTNIFISLRRRLFQIKTSINHVKHPTAIRMARHRQAMSSSMWLQLTLVVCYLPHGILTNLWTTSPSMFFTKQCMLTLVFLNSSLNPILYCWKIRQVRREVKGIIRQIMCSSN